ncbi:MAG: TonB family protein [Bacteroidales bacterium]|nr:TonB family protein [Bacteroidales bacterium]MDD4822508.1 TonB family protein [Bacteroidales bacterium]
MGAWFIFMIKSVFCLTTLFLFYKVLLSKETFHTLNRYLLLGILTIAIVLPFFKIPTAETRPIQLAFHTLELAVSSQANEQVEGYMLPEVTVSANVEKGFDLQLFITICLAIYLTGATVRALFLARSLYTLKRTIRKARKVQYGKYTIAIVPGKVSPYSWWHYIVLSEEDYEETNGEILAHELAHLSRHHSTDILLCELFVIFQWFNPAVYLLKQELQSIHEYEADMAVLENGFNPTQYQLLLIKKAVGTSSFTLANSLNHSSLKKRITMMLRKRSNRWASLKAVGFLPLAALMLSAFARPEVSAKTEMLTGMTSTENVSDKDTVPQKKEPIGGITIVEKANTTDATKKDAKESSAKVVVSSESGDPNKVYTIRIRDKASLDKSAKPLIVIDGVPTDIQLDGANINDLTNSHSPLKGINPADIESIEILKEASATTIYGEKGKDGVVLITTKKGAKKPAGVQIVATSGDPGSAYTIRLDGEHRADNPLIVIDGVPYDLDLNGANINDLSNSHSPLKDIDPKDIKSIEILKDSAATTIYGEKGKNGVVLITTKKGSSNSGAKITAKSADPNSEYIIKIRGNNADNKSNTNDQEPFAYGKVDNPPAFPGGDAELMGWIMKNVQYPEGAKARGEAGRVTVSFIINKDGKVVNGQVERGVSTELDQEALRVVSIMPNWTPGKLKGEAVDVRYMLPITFRLSNGEGTKPAASK